ncbi:MAG: RNA-binding cell elongation regulator Jag/EloR [Acidimicrobiia bacterium]
MEWVEVQGKTVDLAVDVAVEELGLNSREDAKVEIIQEPKPGFLGMGGRDAIVKVSRAPKKRRRRRSRARSGKSRESATNRQDAGKGRSGRGRSEGRNSREPGQEKQVSKSDADRQERQSDERPEQAPIEEQAEVAAGFITGLLDAFGLEGTVETRIEDDVLYIEVEGSQTEALVGPKGSVMQSVHELTRTVVQRKTYGAPRMRIDIAGYRKRRREALNIYTGKLASQVVEEQGEIMLEPMNAADRKVVHDAVADIEHVRSFSEGDEPRRAVVLSYEE